MLKKLTLALGDCRKLNQVLIPQIGHRHVICKEVEIVLVLWGVLHFVGWLVGGEAGGGACRAD